MKKTDQKTTIEDLKNEIREFIQERDWEQFHNGKNLSMSLAIEAAELMEHFQWSDSNAPVDAATLEKIRHEIADVVVYALDFCNLMQIDLATAVSEKMKLNRLKYPVRKVRGKSHKYTYYQDKARAAAKKRKGR